MSNKKMKSIKPIFILILLLSNAIMFGQNTINGEWYTPVRNKLLKVTIKEDSLYLTKQKFDLNEKSDYLHEGLFKIEKKTINGEIISFILSESRFIDPDLGDKPTKTGKQTFYKIATFRWDANSKKNTMAIFSFNSDFDSKESAEESLKSIPDNFIGINLYDKSGIETASRKKEVQSMTADDLKNYLKEAIQFAKDAKNNLPKYKLNYVFRESAGRELVSKAGFNPFYKGREMELIFAKYSEDPEVKKLMSELKNL